MLIYRTEVICLYFLPFILTIRHYMIRDAIIFRSHRRQSPVNFERLSMAGPLWYFDGISKLVAIQFTQSLQRLLANESIYVNCCNPGAVATDLNRDIEAKFGMIAVYILALLQKLFFQPVQIGALTQLYLAASPDVG
jgi:hypothetical protein